MDAKSKAEQKHQLFRSMNTALPFLGDLQPIQHNLDALLLEQKWRDIHFIPGLVAFSGPLRLI